MVAAFRTDIQDLLLRRLFDTHRLNLLRMPRGDLEPTQVVLKTGDGVFGPLDASEVMLDVVLPAIRRGDELADVAETFSSSADTAAQAGFFGSIFAGFWPGGGLADVSARAEAQGATRLSVRFSDASRDRVALPELAKAVSSGSLDLSMFEAGDAPRAFVITEVYRCVDFEMVWTDDRGVFLGAEAVLAEAARAGVDHRTGRGEAGHVLVGKGRALAFGFRALEIVAAEEGVLRLRLEHVKLDVLGESGDPEREGALLPDRWGGDHTVDLRPLRPRT